MPKPRPPYLLKEVTRHNKIIWYVRIGHGKRIRIRGTYGTQEFVDNYKSALAELQGIIPPKPKTGKLIEGSFAWLLKQYFNSSDWYCLAKATKRQKELILMKVCDSIGNIPYQAIEKKHIVAGVERRKETPAMARNFLKALNGLFNWAIDQGLLESNPTVGVKRPALNNKDGFAVWTEDDVEKYYQRWSHGTHERVWIDVLLYTGLRRGDAVRIGWKNVKDNIIHLKTEKSKYQTDVFLPILPELAETLKIGPIGNETFICSKTNQKFIKESFGNAFRDACNAAGIKKSAHGLRKLAATRAANSGATVSQLKAIFGWTEDQMASLYTKSADRKRLALEAIKKLQKS
ncbi:tyrosine-type recombinase/integrase [Bartonella tribocorum]|uniref:Phage-related integrase/recombinase n=1 Tax=Bartonella tribocorum (strain DSM 28219 / CCUG 45778 / CIP 105476 / IBS 506) TaxID=382640 RepID=A9IT43_BART1|nr:tyrosine-type recombinase/integrase [Bartonella tribocorum]CAK01379.1 phage-related integrase/recombinase [Bartonella tribocorum CIP 105476]CDO48603.1 phage-related integrase/recombinase [Bartonella tribocorum]